MCPFCARIGCARSIFGKDLFHGGVTQLGAAVFVDDALVVHRARAGPPPLFADAYVAELPDVHPRAGREGEHRFELFAQRLRLEFFAPFGGVGAAPPVQPARADLGDEEGLARALRALLHPAVQVGQVFARGRIVVPTRIDVVGDDVGQAEADVRLEFAAGKGEGAGAVEGAQDVELAAVAFFAVFAVAGAFVEDAPDVDAGVVVVLQHHFARHAALGGRHCRCRQRRRGGRRLFRPRRGGCRRRNGRGQGGRAGRRRHRSTLPQNGAECARAARGGCAFVRRRVGQRVPRVCRRNGAHFALRAGSGLDDGLVRAQTGGKTHPRGGHRRGQGDSYRRAPAAAAGEDAQRNERRPRLEGRQNEGRPQHRKTDTQQHGARHRHFPQRVRRHPHQPHGRAPARLRKERADTLFFRG